MEWFEEQSTDEQEAMLDRLIYTAVNLGVELPEAQEQRRIDTIARELLEDINL